MSNTDIAVMWISYGVFNLAVLFLLRFALGGIDIQSTLREKAHRQLDGAGTTPNDTSFSRVAGITGAIVLASFFWGLGDVIIYRAFTAPDQIKTIVESCGTFFMAGAALFAPYAFNQLASIFQAKP